MFPLGLLTLGLCACGPTTGDPAPPELALLTRDACVLTDTMRTRLDEAIHTAGLSATYKIVDLATLRPDDPRVGYPTPTLLFANRDVFGMPQPVPPFPEPT